MLMYPSRTISRRTISKLFWGCNRSLSSSRFRFSSTILNVNSSSTADGSDVCLLGERHKYPTDDEASFAFAKLACTGKQIHFARYQFDLNIFFHSYSTLIYHTCIYRMQNYGPERVYFNTQRYAPRL